MAKDKFKTQEQKQAEYLRYFIYGAFIPLLFAIFVTGWHVANRYKKEIKNKFLLEDAYKFDKEIEEAKFKIVDGYYLDYTKELEKQKKLNPNKEFTELTKEDIEKKSKDLIDEQNSFVQPKVEFDPTRFNDIQEYEPYRKLLKDLGSFQLLPFNPKVKVYSGNYITNVKNSLDKPKSISLNEFLKVIVRDEYGRVKQIVFKKL